MKKNLYDLLMLLRESNIRIDEDIKGNIIYRAPKGAVSEEIVAKMKLHKNELLQYVQTQKRIVDYRMYRNGSENIALVKVSPLKTVKQMKYEADFFDTHANDVQNKLIESELSNDIIKWIDIANELAIKVSMNAFLSVGIFAKNRHYSLNEIVSQIVTENSNIIVNILDILVNNKIISKKEDRYIKCDQNKTEDNIEVLWNDFKSIDLKVNGNNTFYCYYKKSCDCLLDILTENLKPLELLFPQGDTSIAESIYKDNSIINGYNDIISSTILEIIMNNKNKKHKILEIGAGVGGTSIPVLEKLNSVNNYEYTFSDVSNFFTNLAKANLHNKNIIYSIFDINKPIHLQDIKNQKFDVIICANVLHNAFDINDSLDTIKKLLETDGIFIILEQVHDYEYLYTSVELNIDTSNVVDFRKENKKAFLTHEQWENVFEKNGAHIISLYPKNEVLDKFGMKLYTGYFDETYSIDIDMLNLHFKITEKSDNVYLCKDFKFIEENDEMYLDDNFDGEIPNHINAKSSVLWQEKLEDIWKDTFNLNVINGTSNFYDLGGDSLLLTQLISKIWKEISITKQWDWNKFADIISANPSIQDLSKMINELFTNPMDESEAFNKNKYNKNTENLLDYNDSKPLCVNIFFHDGTGELSKYDDLISCFKKNNANTMLFYGLRYREENIKQDKNLIISLAEKYSLLIKENFSNQEIKLIGYCVGGAIAYETANILNERYKITVQEVIIISSFVNSQLITKSISNSYLNNCLTSDCIMALLFSEILSISSNVQVDKTIVEKYFNQDEKIKEQIELNYNVFKDINKYNSIFDTVKKHFYAVLNYIPSFYSGNVCFITGINYTENNFLEDKNDFCSDIDIWNKFFLKQYRCYALDCNHINILDKKMSSIISKIIIGN